MNNLNDTDKYIRFDDKDEFVSKKNINADEFKVFLYCIDKCINSHDNYFDCTITFEELKKIINTEDYDEINSIFEELTSTLVIVEEASVRRRCHLVSSAMCFKDVEFVELSISKYVYNVIKKNRDKFLF